MQERANGESFGYDLNSETVSWFHVYSWLCHNFQLQLRVEGVVQVFILVTRLSRVP